MSEPTERPTWELPLKALASYMNQVQGLDRSWSEDGLCRQFPVGANDEAWRNKGWVATYHDGDLSHRPRERESTEKAKVALMVCHNCPVQYECAGYGVKSKAEAGIYGVRDSNLKWLRRYGKGSLLDKLLAEGQRSGLAVEVFVSRKRHLAEAAA